MLRREVRQLGLEQDLLNKAYALLKMACASFCNSYPPGEDTADDSLKELLGQLGLARSSYFCHRTRATVGDKYLQVRQCITEIFELDHLCYGYRRLQASFA